jgi:hypothetical protein
LNLDETPVITFNDDFGNQFPIHDRKDIETMQIAKKESIPYGTDLDELASRVDMYGDGSEDLMSVIVEANVIKFAENNFEMTNIKEVDIPVIGE